MALTMCALLLLPAPVLAQDVAAQTERERRVEVHGTNIELGLPPTPEQWLEADLRRAERRTRAAGVGLGVSVPAIVAGPALLARGITRNFCLDISECPSDPGAAAMKILGPVLFVAGIIGTGVSASTFRKARKDKRRLQDELRKTTVRLSPTTITVMHRF
jgi:hypothetical protein